MLPGKFYQIKWKMYVAVRFRQDLSHHENGVYLLFKTGNHFTDCTRASLQPLLLYCSYHFFNMIAVTNQTNITPKFTCGLDQYLILTGCSVSMKSWCMDTYWAKQQVPLKQFTIMTWPVSKMSGIHIAACRHCDLWKLIKWEKCEYLIVVLQWIVL